MNNNLLNRVYQRLLQDFTFKERGEYLQQGICPSCGKKELYTHAASPWVLRCNRANKCGESFHIKDLYPELFQSFSDTYPKTKENPAASADAYLENARGFKLADIKGTYTQEAYYDPKTDKGSATIRFQIAEGVYWERLIDKAHEFDRKANFKGSYQGFVWSHPDDDFKDVKEIWITEGIFDAIALRQAGYSAVSILTCSNYPEHFLEGLKATNPDATLIFALDTDKAGRKFTKSHAKKAIENGWTATAAQPPSGKKKLDWNDLLQLEKLTPTYIDTYRYYGKLLLAKSATEKAILMYQHKERHEFHLDYDNRLYYFKLDIEKFQKAIASIEDSNALLTHEMLVEQAVAESKTVKEICNCKPTILYFQRNNVSDESWYYLQIDFPHGGQAKNTFTAGQLANSSDFKKRLLHIAKGGLWMGNSALLDSFIKSKIQLIPEVATIDFKGYSKKHATYVFTDIAVHMGKLIMLNEEDYFNVGKTNLKSLERSVELTINPDLKAYSDEWIVSLHDAFGAKGLIALTYWFGSLFAEQIRTIDKSYPFFEFVGKAGSGKSTLIEFLWKLFGRENYEGFDPAKATLSGRTRNFAQVANIPIVLMEGDHTQSSSKRQAFDFDELKPLYNSRSIRTRGMMTNGNETYEPPFRASIVIEQNEDVVASTAILERIIYMHTDLKSHTDKSSDCAVTLEQMPIETVSGFILKATLAEKEIMSTFVQQKREYLKVLFNTEGLKHRRIIKNHAQMLALLDCLSLIVPLQEAWINNAQEMLVDMAKQRQNIVRADTPNIQIFWEIYDFLILQDCRINHHASYDSYIAVNLNEFYQKASDWKQPLPQLHELKKQLQHSIKHKYVEQKTVKSIHLKKSVRCYIFKKKQ